MTVIDITGYSSYSAAPRELCEAGRVPLVFKTGLLRLMRRLLCKDPDEQRTKGSLTAASRSRSTSVAVTAALPWRRPPLSREQELMKQFQVLADTMAAQYAVSAQSQDKVRLLPVQTAALKRQA